MSDQVVIALKKEGGKSVSVNAAGNSVAVIFWRKSGSVLLPIELNVMEARNLAAAISAAADEARGQGKGK